MRIENSKAVQITKIFDLIRSRIPNDVLITCSQWAEKNRILPSQISYKTGPFRFENTPYTREIADCFSKNSPVREVATMKGVQLGFTTSVIENAVGYTIGEVPAPSMFVFPSDKECEEYKKIKIDSLIDNSNLRSKIKAETENRNTRRTGDTAFLLEFPGGFLKFVSARKGPALRSTHIQNLWFDEVDGYPDEIKNEGSPIEIAKKRTDSYSKERKIFYGSTPARQHKSKIKELYDKGDKRKYYVPCPFCNKMQELVFYNADGGEYSDENAVIKKGVKTKPFGLVFNYDDCINGDFSSVAYKCKHCGKEIKEAYKKDMEQKGQWVATDKSKIPFYRSYHISALYSLTKSWQEIVIDFIEAGNDPKKLQTFYNLDLGLPFEERTGGVEYQQVHRLKDDEMPPNVVPKEAFFLTAAVDVQRDRLEVEIKAWGDRYRCWGIDHRVFKGNIKDVHDECWKRLAAIKDEVFSKNRQIEIMLVDSGDGENRDVVYSFCDLYGEGLIYPLKGFDSHPRVKEKFKTVDIKDFPNLVLVEIYVDLYKNTLARCLAQEERHDGVYPDGWFSFASTYSDEYFRQLTTERKVKKKTPSGTIITKWEQHGRNEAFDLNVYNLCACDLIISQYSRQILKSEFSNPREVFSWFKNINAQSA